ncbi:RagB/SusD family nutrient uptake outer membrane protein [Olivibacter jilunii]|uniref:RagB/SusD family nutrient uptake outer membrane protein n=1 Tax=Olivibacter jilunii TaxID=985016 RepID=UPI003F134EBC
MKKYTYIFTLAIASIFLLNGCKDALDLNPHNSLPEQDVVNETYARQLINGVYEQMQLLDYYGRDFQVVSEVIGDNVKITSANSNRFLNEFRYLWNPTLSSQTATWQAIYKTIYAANIVINELPESNVTIPYKGEAYFLRALAHLDAARRFARPYTNVATNPSAANSGIPVVLEAVKDPANFHPNRNTLEETYNAIIGDLKRAQEMAPDMSSGSSEVYRGSKDAATALLCRVYLYMGRYEDCINEANKIVSKYPLWSTENISTAFSGNNTSEEIFSLKFKSTENRGADNFGQMYNNPDIGYGDIRPTGAFLALMDDSDIRWTFVEEKDGDFFLTKFAGNTAEGADGLVDIKILRIAEIYLSRAEAYAKLGDVSSSLADLNKLRMSRGLSAFTSSGVDALTEEIKIQRKLEFVGEGLRGTDIFRNNETRKIEDADALSSLPISPDNFRVAFSIPIAEMDANPNMVQNPGY